MIKELRYYAAFCIMFAAICTGVLLTLARYGSYSLIGVPSGITVITGALNAIAWVVVYMFECRNSSD